MGGAPTPPPPPCPYAYVLNKCLYGEAPSRGPTPYPLIYYFSLKRYPFRISSVDKLYPFHIPCLALCIPFNCCKCTVFSIGINHKSRTFSRLSPFGPFHGPKWQISLPFYILQLVKSLHFHVPEAWEWYPFGAEPLCIGHQREYPPRGLQEITTQTQGRSMYVKSFQNAKLIFRTCSVAYIPYRFSNKFEFQANTHRVYKGCLWFSM